MRSKRLGSLEMSAVALGCNNFGFTVDEGAARRVLHAALDVGITTIDTADVYGGMRSEEWIGRGLGSRRAEAVIVTKFGNPLPDGGGGAAPTYVARAAEASLRRLQCDVIDLYLLHRPDPSTPIADTLAALNQLVVDGKVREIGCSNFSVEQLEAADKAAVDGAARFVCVQNHYSLVHRNDKDTVLPACDRLGMQYMPYLPLASGLLTGKYRRGQEPPKGSRLAVVEQQRSWLLTDAMFDQVERLEAWASARGRTLVELAIAALASRTTFTSVVAGATTPDQVRANAQGGDWVLTDDELRAVDDLAARTTSR